jgi:hypothetical protein
MISIKMYSIVCLIAYTGSLLYAMEMIQPVNYLCRLRPEVLSHIIDHVFDSAGGQVSTELFLQIHKKWPNNAWSCIGVLHKTPSEFLGSAFILQQAMTSPQIISLNESIDYRTLFKQFPSTQQEAFLDCLYTKKYSSPLWQSVKEISDEKNYKKRDMGAIRTRIDHWSQYDPAALLYTQLTDNQYHKNEIVEGSFKLFYQSRQGLCVQLYHGDGGYHSEDHTTRTITQTAHGYTEMPLILALSHHKYHAPDRMDEGRERYTQTVLEFTKAVKIKTICDVDIEALKTTHQKSVYIRFGNILQDAIISPRIAELNNTTIDCNVIPDTLAYNQQLHLGNDPRKTDKQIYYTTYPYWRLKAVASVGLFLGAWYLAKKYIIDESNTFNEACKILKDQARMHAFNTEIKPLLTPEATHALQVIAEIEPLPQLLSHVGTLQNTVSINADLLARACTIITQTNAIATRCYPVHEATFSLVSRASSSLKLYLVYPLGLLQTMGTIFQVCVGPHEIRTDLNFFMTSVYRIMFPPVRDMMALAVSVFKPKWLPYFIDKILTIQECSENS